MNVDKSCNDKMQPFLTWTGGKRSLLPQIIPLVPKKFNNYFEPFLGGGALFFKLYSDGCLKDKNIYLSDINRELINAFNVVKNKPKELIDKLEEFKNKQSKDFYYEIRSWDRKDDFIKISEVLRAARFIYLGKTCFNGLYRVNKKNQYNESIGDCKHVILYNEESILACSKALQHANINNNSYTETLKLTKSNDLIYLDPPYYPLKPNIEYQYNKDNFGDIEHNELYLLFDKLNKRGCKLLHSNSNSNFIKTLYKKYKQVNISTYRLISRDISQRGKINELTIRNY